MTEEDEPFFLLDDEDEVAGFPGTSDAAVVESDSAEITEKMEKSGLADGLGRLADAVTGGASMLRDAAMGAKEPVDEGDSRSASEIATKTAPKTPSRSPTTGVKTTSAIGHITTPQASLEAEIIQAVELDEASISDSRLALDGVHTFDWPLRGMDCPDCAMKAVRASSRLPGVESVAISAVTGRVRVDMDVGVGSISRVGSVLSSLGHSADLTWQRVEGQTPTSVMQRRGIDRRTLQRSLLATPGILDADLVEGQILLLRAPMFEPDLRRESDASLAATLGGRIRLVEHRSKNLRPDQWRLLGAAATIPLLLLITWLQRSEISPSVILVTSAIGILFAGWRMFAEAVASIRNMVLGFQLLVTFAVLGALWLGEYQEALMVTGLVAFSSHLEERALVRAREAMQGGLDRLPNTARVIGRGSGEAVKGDTGGDSTENCESEDCDDHDHSKHDHAKHDHADHDHSKHDQTKIEATNTTNESNAPPESSESEMLPLPLVGLGDLIEIRSGEAVPVDGVMVEGSGFIDRAPLTGESLPTKIAVGELLEAGLTLVRGPVVIKATAVGEETRLAGLMDLVRTYREVPPRLQGSVELFTFIWVPLVLVGAALIGFIQGSLTTTLLLWVVACPCALLLAAPIPHATSLSVASSRGVIVRGGDVLERVAKIDLALLDKTGTLTSGKPRLAGITVAADADTNRALRLAAGLEQRSNHPYASAILNELKAKNLDAMRVTGISDGEAGLSGKTRAGALMFGRADWIAAADIEIPKSIQVALEEARDAGQGVSILAEAGQAIALFNFVHDDVRPGALELVTALRQRGVEVELLSGDEQKAVERFGASLGISSDNCRGGVTPEGKASWIKSRTATRRTLMAGDGFNDAAALALADVGIAVGSGDQVNLDAADVLIPGDDPRAIEALVDIARRARWLVIANLALSMVLTLTLVGLVISGYNLTLTAGVLLHEASALVVILNGMWVGGTLRQRVGTLGGIFADVGRDFKETVLMLVGRDPKSATD